eukprot:934405-Rhodomonas_salina.1
MLLGLRQGCGAEHRLRRPAVGPAGSSIARVSTGHGRSRCVAAKTVSVLDIAGYCKLVQERA